jgi:hypothetical protein
MDDLRRNLGDHLHAYITYTSKIRYTSEITKSWFTGIDNNGLTVIAPLSDNLFTNFNRKYGKTIEAIGALDGILMSVLRRPYSILFHNYTERADDQPYTDYHPYSFYFLEENRKQFDEDLNYWNNNNLSSLLYVEETDHLQHGESGSTNV